MTIWSVDFDGYDPDSEGTREALCTVGNGRFATRGALPEADADGVHYPGTYIAGCFDRATSTIAEHTIETESMVNAPNWLPLSVRIADGPWLSMDSVEVLEHHHSLDMRTGVLIRRSRFRDEDGRETALAQRRLVHMREPHIAALETTIVAENWSGPITIRSALDGLVENNNVERYRAFEHRHLEPVRAAPVGDDIVELLVTTRQSGIEIAEAVRTRLYCDGREIEAERALIERPGYIGQEISIEIEQGRPLIVEKIVALATSRDDAISEPAHAARLRAQRASEFGTLLREHQVSWHHLWRRFHVRIDNDDETSRVINLHVFHLLQTVSEHCADLDVGVPARGLHGEGYRGHIFWDDLLIFPFLSLRVPQLTRALLLYRYRRLPAARAAAADAGHPGAMFPWQSGSDGTEATPRLLFNVRSNRWINDHSALQRHGGAAIAYNVWHYYQVSADMDFMASFGAELLLEIARFLASICTYNAVIDRYEIRGVVGPDEYHDSYPDSAEPGVNNNAYTNVMTAWVLSRALDALELLQEPHRERLLDLLGLGRDEIERWDEISRKLLIPFHGDGIISQFEGYGDLEEFDWDAYRRKYGNIQRLDMILESEGDTANRYQLSKQADVLMLFYVLSADQLGELFDRLGYPFEYETIPRNVAYYTERTAHGSTLSRVVQSWVLARGDREASWHVFTEALESDIADIQGGTTREGIHLGAMAGTIDLVQRCYTGLETRGDVLWLNPLLPDELESIHTDIGYRQHWIEIDVTSSHVSVRTLPGYAPPIRLGLRGQVFEMGPGETRQFELATAG